MTLRVCELQETCFNRNNDFKCCESCCHNYMSWVYSLNKLYNNYISEYDINTQLGNNQAGVIL